MNTDPPTTMSTRFSFFVLVAAVVGAGVLFFQVVEPFLFPLFFAGVLALLFWPVHVWTAEHICLGHRRISAAVMTAGILFLVMLPITGALFLSARELIDVGREIVEWLQPPPESEVDREVSQLRQVMSREQFDQVRNAVFEDLSPAEVFPGIEGTVAGEILARLANDFPRAEVVEAFRRERANPLERIRNHPLVRRVQQWLEPLLSDEDIDRLRDTVLRGLEGIPQALYARTTALLGDAVYFLIGFAVLVVGLYYFFVDGPDFLRRLQRLSPLDDRDEEILFARFQRVCRGVVLATIVSSFVQAALATVGFIVVGAERPVLLGIITLLFSMVPFVGSAGVWGPVAIYLLFHQQYTGGLVLIAYGTAVVSTSDNLVKTYVIHGQGQLHPLVVFVTMLGALRVIGLWGIFIGPLVAAVFYALLTLLHRHLEPEDVEML